MGRHLDAIGGRVDGHQYLTGSANDTRQYHQHLGAWCSRHDRDHTDKSRPVPLGQVGAAGHPAAVVHGYGERGRRAARDPLDQSLCAAMQRDVERDHRRNQRRRSQCLRGFLDGGVQQPWSGAAAAQGFVDGKAR